MWCSCTGQGLESLGDLPVCGLTLSALFQLYLEARPRSSGPRAALAVSLLFPGCGSSALTSVPLLQAQKVSDDLMQKISSQNRRALDLVVAKCYYYHSRIYEFLNKLDVVRR